MDELLKRAIDKELIKKPANDFTDSVMNKVFALEKAREVQPLLSKKAWVVILVGLVIFFVLILTSSAEEAAPAYQFNFIERISEFINTVELKEVNLFSGINLILVSATSLVIFLLLFFDSVFFKKN